MNTQFKAKLLQHISSKKEGNEGFTLIELLVVVIIIGVLAAVALPNLLGQVGKARETEAKNGIGNLNRAQQTYHFEKQLFANAQTTANLGSNTNVLGVVVTSSYYNLATAAGDAASVTQTATAINYTKDGVRAYSGGVAFGAGKYVSAICQMDAIGAAPTAPTMTSTPSATCTGESTQLK